MKTENKIIRPTASRVLLLCLILFLAAEFLGHWILTGLGTVDVSNVWIRNTNDLMIRGKLFVPEGVSESSPAPGVVYLHGYQNNRETSEPYAVELSRRGVVVLCLDTLGRGNSDNQFREDEPGFDETYGGLAAFEYLRELPFVDAQRCGMGGHSLGGEMAYTAALANPEIKALVFSGFAWDLRAGKTSPQNMLMIFGKYDEYRRRMTGVRDFQEEWMTTPQTYAALGISDPVFDETYGSFEDGTARRVHMTDTTHVGESFDAGAIAEAVSWFQKALGTGSSLDPRRQVWRVKEICSLIAMLAAVFSIIPLSLLLLKSRPFAMLAGRPGTSYVCTRGDFRKAVLINGILSLLYLPLILTIFGIHVYLVPIDRAFPMMMINGIVFWFIIINAAGFLFFRRWFKKVRIQRPEVTGSELGIKPERSVVLRSFLMAAVLFLYVYLLQAGMERLLLIDFRYKFPYASDLTPFRGLMFVEYFVLFLTGYLGFNIFLQAQIRPAAGATWFRTSFITSIRNILVVIIPLLVIMAVQYIPLFLSGAVPFVGPGGALVGFVINLEHMCLILVMMISLSTFLYNSTGTIYTGAFINAMLVAWMFTSSSVIAPIPV